MGASLDDILTAAKNLVVATNSIAAAIRDGSQAYLNVNGALSAPGMTATALVKVGPGRVGSVSVIVPGTTTGMIYDSAGTASLVNPICVIPMTVGVFTVDLPVQFGVVVAPGTGQTVSVGYS